MKKTRAKMQTSVDSKDGVETYDFHVEVDRDGSTTSSILGLAPAPLLVPLATLLVATVVFLAYGIAWHHSWAQCAGWMFAALASLFERWIWKTIATRTVIALVTATNAQIKTHIDGKKPDA